MQISNETLQWLSRTRIDKKMYTYTDRLSVCKSYDDVYRGPPYFQVSHPLFTQATSKG